tara:strand:- start:1239 stop:2339 length:1101 start_codon:yes stop_codon:yes gene_type:complete
MDTTDANIVFNENGVCDHCSTFEKKILPKWNYGVGKEEEAEKLINKIKKNGKGKDFDCILGLSGGIDSSYLLHLVVKKYNLRPLVFHVDAGWNSQLATNNIENLVDKLNLDLFTEVINWNEIKDLQLSFFKSGVPHIDTPQDHAFFATMYKFAAKHNIKSIITGGNYSTECLRNPKEWMYFQSDSTQIKDIQKKFGKLKLRNFPMTNILWHKLWLPYFRGIKLYRLLDLMEYNKESAKNTLVKEYAYQPYKQKHFESRFTKFYESYWLYERFGFDTRKVQLSSLILTNQISREEALETLKTKPYDEENIKHEFEYISKKLDISIDELKMYFIQPIKSYKDYKNNEIIYDIGSWVMRKIGKELGGKR